MLHSIHVIIESGPVGMLAVTGNVHEMHVGNSQYAAALAGIRRVHELWPDLDEDALRNSEPRDLALAVRALSDTGPPKKWS